MKKNGLEFLHEKTGTRFLFWLGIAGMGLLLLSELWPAKPAAETGQNNAASTDVILYEQQLEQRLALLISQMEGAGEAQVMLTLSSSEEAVYALDTQQKGEDGSIETHVILGDGSALCETTYSPTVSGVAVVCEGGGDIVVVARITEMLSALLDLSTNRISVQKMK